jgi:hypothetical protein
MMDADGGLNNLGKQYIGADTVVKSGPITNTVASTVNAGPTKPLATATAGPDRKPSFLPGNHAPPKWDLPLGGLIGVVSVAILSAWSWL